MFYRILPRRLWWHTRLWFVVACLFVLLVSELFARQFVVALWLGVDTLILIGLSRGMVKVNR